VDLVRVTISRHNFEAPEFIYIYPKALISALKSAIVPITALVNVLPISALSITAVIFAASVLRHSFAI
jgi:hypothetical protein